MNRRLALTYIAVVIVCLAIGFGMTFMPLGVQHFFWDAGVPLGVVAGFLVGFTIGWDTGFIRGKRKGE
jgi:hypothetical protein